MVLQTNKLTFQWKSGREEREEEECQGKTEILLFHLSLQTKLDHLGKMAKGQGCFQRHPR